ncbi:hypothetical protein CgunFtcFv8_018813 [Champsocephalus gunnari]|uniref:Uncharacterized protein n=1 Tax=Champsocephalus gunnari TaxID=52237 RepID=A0AAN8BU74_CHAGU|nr:hypothetical protein CgunFtcFv8_018813 [Champsocephalus gunnari]
MWTVLMLLQGAWPQRRLCAAGGLSQMKGCNPRLKYVAKPVSVDEEVHSLSLTNAPRIRRLAWAITNAFYNFNWIS